MTSSSDDANLTLDSKRWGQLLAWLDEKLQFGLLEHLRRVESYRFQGASLYIKPGSVGDREYLSRASVQSQLHLFAEDAIEIKEIIIVE